MTNITDAFSIEKLSINDSVLLVTGSNDPSIGAGYEAPIGSLYLYSTTGNSGLYIKTSTNNTNWDKVWVGVLTPTDVGLSNVVNSLQIINAGGTPSILSDTFANIPAAGTTGRLFLATDTMFLYRDTGSIWIALKNYSSDTWLIKTTTYTALLSDNIIADTNGGVFTITLPASPGLGDRVRIKDSRGTFATNNLTVARNGSNIVALASDLILDINNADITFVYQDSTIGWTI